MKYVFSLFLLCSVTFFAQNTDSLPKTRKGHVFWHGKDTMMEIVLDHRYGTTAEVIQKINDGELECYYVKEGGLVYQRFRVLEKTSFIEDYWVLMTCAAIVVLIGAVYYKRKPQDK